MESQDALKKEADDLRGKGSRDKLYRLRSKSFGATPNASNHHNGEVAERLNAPVSKTGMASGSSRVRIPPSPLDEGVTEIRGSFFFLAASSLVEQTWG